MRGSLLIDTLVSLSLAGLLATEVAATGVPTNWESIGPYGGEMRSIAWSPLDPSLAVATTRHVVYVSRDAGATWTESWLFTVPASSPHPTNNIVFDPVSPSRFYVLDDGGGVARTDDAGSNWSVVHRWPGELTAFAIDPDDVNNLHAYVTLRGPLGEFLSYRMESADAGLSWTEIGWTRNCDEASGVRAVAFTDESPRRRLELVPEFGGCVGSQWSSGLYAVGAQGTTLLSDVGTFPNATVRPATRLVIGFDAWYMQLGSSLLRSVNFGANWTTVRSGNYDSSMSDERIVAASNAGVYQSTDGGDSWVLASTTEPTYGPVAPVPAVAADSSGRMLATTRLGMVRSIDGGATWTPASQGLTNLRIRAVEVAGDGTIWAGQGEPGFTGVSMGVLRSTDGGQGWQKSEISNVAAYIRDIRLDSATSSRPGGGRLHASGSNCLNTNCTSFGPAGFNNGIYVSEDGGVSWAVSGSGIPQTSDIGVVRALALDPHAETPAGTSQLVAGTSAYAGQWLVSRSVNFGSNWSGTAGLPSQQNYVSGAVTDLMFDPLVAGVAYATVLADNPYDSPPNSIASGVFRSTDGGASWVLTSSGLPMISGWPNARQPTYSVVADWLRPDRLWSAGSMRSVDGSEAPWVYRSVDGGASWNSCGPGLPTLGSPRRIAQSNVNSNVLALAVGSTSLAQGRVMVSRDGCSSWTEVPNPAIRSATEILIRGAKIYAGTDRGVFVTVVDGIELLSDGFE